MLASFASDWHGSISTLGHRDCLHPTRQLSRLEFEHVHPFTHDEVIVRIDSAVGLVLDECHEGGESGACFVLRWGRGWRDGTDAWACVCGSDAGR